MHGFPESFHQYPAFLSYLKEFYPTWSKISGVCEDGSGSIVSVELGQVEYNMHIPNYNRRYERKVVEIV